MRPRQTIARQWLIIDGTIDLAQLRQLPRGTGLMLLVRPAPSALRRLRCAAQLRDLEVVIEGPRTATRVHNIVELRRAMLRRVRPILLSPIFETRSHPDWKAIPRMRAAALARLGNRGLIALGGMDQRRFATVACLGFIGWAGIGAWLKVAKVTR